MKPPRLARAMSKARQALNRRPRPPNNSTFEPDPATLPIQATIAESKAKDAIYIVLRVMHGRNALTSPHEWTGTAVYAGTKSLDRARTLAANYPTRAIVETHIGETGQTMILYDNNKPPAEV